jgi:hypothetical protein
VCRGDRDPPRRACGRVTGSNGAVIADAEADADPVTLLRSVGLRRWDGIALLRRDRLLKGDE